MKTINFRIQIFALLIAISGFTGQPGVCKKTDYRSEYMKAWGIVKYFTPFKENLIPDMDSAFIIDISRINNNNCKRVFNKAVKCLIAFSRMNSREMNIDEGELPRHRMLDIIAENFPNAKKISRSNLRYLVAITQFERYTDNPFVKSNPGSYNAQFTSEKRYISPFPIIEIRLLALARYWNAIYYFYPHRNTVAVNWSTVLDTAIKELMSCKNEEEFHLFFARYSSYLKDGHANTESYPLNKYYGFYQLPCQLSYINEQLFITDIHKTAINGPFKFGDIIIDINNQTFQDFYEKNSSFVWGSNSKRKKNISAKHFIRLKEEKSVFVKLQRNDSLIVVSTPVLPISSSDQSEFINFKENQAVLLGNNYIYLDLSKTDSLKFEEQILLTNKPNIIIDLRSYPNWVLNQIADLFTCDSLAFSAYQCPNIFKPGHLQGLKPIYLSPKSTAKKAVYKKLILIVDYTTISRGEFIGMAFQCLPNVITVGDKTAGADGDVSDLLLPGFISTRFTGLSICYPDGTQTQQKGIRIDIPFFDSGKGIIEGHDEKLNYIIDNLLALSNH